MNKKTAYCYDFETIRSCFLAIYINVKDTSDMFIFEVSDFKNDIKSFIKFNEKLIKNQNYIVDFNGLEFDCQVAHEILKKKRKYLKMSGSEASREIFTFVEKLFDHKNKEGYSIYRHYDFKWKSIDLAAINNYNNTQKFASLKWLQYNMDWPNIMDMDCKPTDILNQKDIKQLTKYCINDCLSTRELLKRNVEQIEVRNELTKYFGIPLQNLSEPKLVKAILSNLLAKDMGISEKELRRMQTNRKEIHLSEVILPYIKFKTPKLKQTLGKFKSLILDAQNLKGSFKHKVNYRGLEYSFALGGIHGAKRGIYESKDGMVIKSFDV